MRNATQRNATQRNATFGVVWCGEVCFGVLVGIRRYTHPEGAIDAELASVGRIVPFGTQNGSTYVTSLSSLSSVSDNQVS
jgi:hypothetical protein